MCCLLFSVLSVGVKLLLCFYVLVCCCCCLKVLFAMSLLLLAGVRLLFGFFLLSFVVWGLFVCSLTVFILLCVVCCLLFVEFRLLLVVFSRVGCYLLFAVC